MARGIRLLLNDMEGVSKAGLGVVKQILPLHGLNGSHAGPARHSKWRHALGPQAVVEGGAREGDGR